MREIGRIDDMVQRPGTGKSRAIQEYPEDIERKEQLRVETQVEEGLLVGLVHHATTHHEHQQDDHYGAKQVYRYV